MDIRTGPRLSWAEHKEAQPGSRCGDAAWVGRQGRQDSNLQPPVLETGALPVELRPSAATMIPACDGAPSRLSSPS
jgi:hypothetical protein